MRRRRRFEVLSKRPIAVKLAQRLAALELARTRPLSAQLAADLAEVEQWLDRALASYDPDDSERVQDLFGAVSALNAALVHAPTTDEEEQPT